MLLCDRPHVKDVDFASVRFIVSKVCGLDVNGQHLELGDLVPEGVMSVESMRAIYDRPLRLIETVEYAVRDSELIQACTRRGVDLENLLNPDRALSNDDSTVIETGTEMCAECGEFFLDLNHHTRKQCRKIQKEKKI